MTSFYNELTGADYRDPSKVVIVELLVGTVVVALVYEWHEKSWTQATSFVQPTE